MRRFVLTLLLSFFSLSVWAQAPLVVATHPIYLIAKEVTQGIEEPQLLLANQSGHDIQLTPAHRRAIQDASLVIWLGKVHEAPLAGLLEQNPKAVSILESNLMTVLPRRNTRGAAQANTVDSHVWLEPNNAVRIGFFIAALRSQQHPENRAKYWSNAQKFANRMLAQANQYQRSGASLPYWSYHDAYQYLERALQLKFYGAMTDDPHVGPTAAQLKYLNDNRPRPRMCLLAEGHANKSQFNNLNPVNFEQVDESMSLDHDFVQGWGKLASQIMRCVTNNTH